MKIEDVYGVCYLLCNIDDMLMEDLDGDVVGYLMLIGDDDLDYVFMGEVEMYLEDWWEECGGIE